MGIKDKNTGDTYFFKRKIGKTVLLLWYKSSKL